MSRLARGSCCDSGLERGGGPSMPRPVDASAETRCATLGIESPAVRQDYVLV